MLSFALQAVALSLGSVVFGAGLPVTALLFALPCRPTDQQGGARRQWIWAVLLAAAVAVFVAVGEPAAGYQRASLQTWAVVALVIGPAMVFCVRGARIWSGPVAAVLLAVVSASSWALFAVLTKAVVDVLPGRPRGAAAHARTVWLVTGRGARDDFPAVGVSGSSLTASLPTMTVTEPVVASVAGCHRAR